MLVLAVSGLKMLAGPSHTFGRWQSLLRLMEWRQARFMCGWQLKLRDPLAIMGHIWAVYQWVYPIMGAQCSVRLLLLLLWVKMLFHDVANAVLAITTWQGLFQFVFT